MGVVDGVQVQQLKLQVRRPKVAGCQKGAYFIWGQGTRRVGGDPYERMGHGNVLAIRQVGSVVLKENFALYDRAKDEQRDLRLGTG